jgi:hypothetical protein
MRALALLSLSLLGLGSAYAQQKPDPYPARLPMEKYHIDQQTEIAMARSAAPPSISADAEVMVLGENGYEVAVKGKNGFVCFIERSWTASFDDPEFWNPKVKAPNCFNPPAARRVLPHYIERTKWIVAGLDRAQLIEKARTAMASRQLVSPEPGSFSFMLSKESYLNDEVGGPGLPHVMFFVPHGQAAAWAAGWEESPVFGVEASDVEPTVLFVPVRRWSDGSPGPAATDHRHHK